jgi:hypothetical protein
MVEVMTDMDKRDFRIVGGKGFALDLPNGVTVSVQWGPGNYCDSDVSNADVFAPAAAAVGGDAWGSDTAECAAYVTGSDLSWVAVPGYTDVVNPYTLSKYWGGDDVCGHMNVSQVLDFINKASQLDLGQSGDYRDDPKIQEDERKVMDEIAIDEYFSNKESNDEDIA